MEEKRRLVYREVYHHNKGICIDCIDTCKRVAYILPPIACCGM